MLTVRAPATSANLGSGFDVFGAALERPADVVRVERAAETTIEVTGAGSQFIPEDPEKNTAGAVAEALDAPARIKIDKGVRPASGLGSSAASAAAAALAADGVTQVDASIPLVVCLPDIVVSTRDARRVVPDTAAVEDIVDTVGRAATLTVGMHRDDPAMVGRGMEDEIVTPARAELIDGYERVREAALDAGATGVTVSGAGPGVIAACEASDRRAIASAMLEAFDDVGVDSRAYQTRIGGGATIY